jgi:ABC-type transporter Mla subunit MlaD
MRTLALSIVTTALLLASGCRSTYYNTMEKLGYPKRDMLVDRVQNARDAQQEAKEQFESALEEFSAVVHFEGGQLEATYKKLNTELERSKSKAKAVRSRIKDVERVAEALFAEWEKELDQYANEQLRDSSEEKLGRTRQRYARMIAAMQSAEMKIGPVLSAFADQVLFLKHNLNAQALASLQSELIAVETDIAGLIKEMETSIAEANTFIESMGQN